MAIYGYLWLFMAIYGYLWLFMAIYGYLWLFVNIYTQNLRHNYFMHLHWDHFPVNI